MENPTQVCPNCSLPVLAEFYFCPNCGRSLRQKQISISTAKQIGIYLLSFFLPPLGLFPGIKYISQGDPKTKMTGWIAVVLTILSIIITIYIFNGFMQQYAKMLGQISNGNFTGF